MGRVRAFVVIREFVDTFVVIREFVVAFVDTFVDTFRGRFALLSPILLGEVRVTVHE